MLYSRLQIPLGQQYLFFLVSVQVLQEAEAKTISTGDLLKIIPMKIKGRGNKNRQGKLSDCGVVLVEQVR